MKRILVNLIFDMTLKSKIDKIVQLRKDNFILKGVFTVFDIENRNGLRPDGSSYRTYTHDVFDREIKKLNEKA